MWKLNYNARDEQHKILITLLATAYNWSHVQCQLNPIMILNDLFKILSVYLHLPRGLFPTRFPNYNSVAVYYFPIRATLPVNLLEFTTIITSDTIYKVSHVIFENLL